MPSASVPQPKILTHSTTGIHAVENLTVEKIGPERAKYLLSNQGPQRRIRPYKIKQYADDMTAGRWEFNAAPIIKDKNGHLRDGQNRLHAVIMSNTEQTFLVLNNASEETIATVDTGLSRTFADVNRMQGIPYATEIAASASVWWKYENDAMRRMDRPSHKQLEATRDAHLNALDAACRLCVPRKNARALAGKSSLIFVVGYIFERDPILAEEFLDALDTGLNMTPDDPMYALRRLLINNQAKRAKMDASIVTALLIKTFNFRYQGRRVQNVMYRSDETYPQFVI